MSFNVLLKNQIGYVVVTFLGAAFLYVTFLGTLALILLYLFTHQFLMISLFNPGNERNNGW
jgi:hypothetical protein